MKEAPTNCYACLNLPVMYRSAGTSFNILAPDPAHNATVFMLVSIELLIPSDTFTCSILMCSFTCSMASFRVMEAKEICSRRPAPTVGCVLFGEIGQIDVNGRDLASQSFTPPSTESQAVCGE